MDKQGVAFDRYDCDERDGPAPLRRDSIDFKGTIEYHECEFCRKPVIIGAGEHCSWCGRRQKKRWLTAQPNNRQSAPFLKCMWPVCGVPVSECPRVK
jgi:hypothetical protein